MKLYVFSVTTRFLIEGQFNKSLARDVFIQMHLLSRLTLIEIYDQPSIEPIKQQRDACIFSTTTRIIAVVATRAVGKMTLPI